MPFEDESGLSKRRYHLTTPLSSLSFCALRLIHLLGLFIELKKLFVMDKESWAKKRAKGKKHYLINTGLFKLGTLVGLFTIILKYLRNIDYELGRFDTSSLLQDFVFPYYPITLLIGLVFAWFTWGGFEKRYGDKKEN